MFHINVVLDYTIVKLSKEIKVIVFVILHHIGFNMKMAVRIGDQFKLSRVWQPQPAFGLLLFFALFFNILTQTQLAVPF